MKRFSPQDPAFLEDPYQVYAQLRRQGPCFYHEPWDTWIFSRAADIEALANDARLGRSLDHLLSPDALAERESARASDMPSFTRYVASNLMETEAATHQRLRARVQAVLNPAWIQGLRQRIDTIVAAIFAQAMQGDSLDFIEDIAEPVPVMVISELLDIPHAARTKLRPWSAAITAMYEPDRHEQACEAAELAASEFAALILALIEQRRANPGQDIISALCADNGAGALSDDEVTATCILLLNAGHEATVNAAGNAVLALMNNPGVYERLVQEPALASVVFEEALRFDAPLHYFHRFALEDFEYAGQRFSFGHRIGLLYASANRDEVVFDNPDEFDIKRSEKRHFAFGRGGHFCLGAGLARLEVQTILSQLAWNLSELKVPAGLKPERHQGFTFRGLDTLPLLNKNQT